jgi:hypothetical protein
MGQRDDPWPKWIVIGGLLLFAAIMICGSGATFLR